MTVFIGYLKADFLKTKHLSIRKAHLLIPVCATVIFLLYYSYTPWNAVSKADAYFQVIGSGLPFLIGLFSVMTAEHESAAGGFHVMLSAPNRQAAFFSKVLILLIFEAAALFLACGLFGTGYAGLLNETVIRYSFYWKAPCILLASSISLYVFHLFLAFKFNRGVSVGAGIMGSLVAALLLTGMGDSIWMYVPYAWPARLGSLFLQEHVSALDAAAAAQCHIAAAVCICLTILTLCLSGMWFRRWDGRKNND